MSSTYLEFFRLPIPTYHKEIGNTTCYPSAFCLSKEFIGYSVSSESSCEVRVQPFLLSKCHCMAFFTRSPPDQRFLALFWYQNALILALFPFWASLGNIYRHHASLTMQFFGVFSEKSKFACINTCESDVIFHATLFPRETLMSIDGYRALTPIRFRCGLDFVTLLQRFSVLPKRLLVL